MSSTIGTVLLALVFPIVWGLVTAWLFDMWRARKAQSDMGAASGDDAE